MVLGNAVTVTIYTSVLSLQCNGRLLVIQHLTKATEAYDKTSLRESSGKRSGKKVRVEYETRNHTEAWYRAAYSPPRFRSSSCVPNSVIDYDVASGKC